MKINTEKFIQSNGCGNKKFLNAKTKSTKFGTKITKFMAKIGHFPINFNLIHHKSKWHRFSCISKYGWMNLFAYHHSFDFTATMHIVTSSIL